MIITSLLIAASIQSTGLGVSLSDRISTSVKAIGESHDAVQSQFGKPDAVVEGNAVWVYGPWVPSPRIGFVASFFRENDGERVIKDGVQYVSGSVGSITKKTLTVVGGRKVPNDFCWVSGESTPSVLTKVNASDVKYFAQKANPNLVLATCTVSSQPVFVFSRQIANDQIVPAFNSAGSPDFDASRLDGYCFAVGQCSEWHYTAGVTQQEITGPGSYADKSKATDPWVQLN